MKFKHVVCGGTFDHFHLGHKKLLEACIGGGEKVTVGVAMGALLNHKEYRLSLESYIKRARNVAQLYPSITVYKLQDIFGPTLTDTTIDAIAVTQDTLNGAHMINNKRKQIAMKPLHILLLPFVFDENNEKISSERIREGVIDRNGTHYYKFLISKEKFILPDSLRGRLRKPLGRVISSFFQLSPLQKMKLKASVKIQGKIITCSVGDMVTFELKKQGISSTISIIDGQTLRQALNSTVMNSILEKERSIAINEKGSIQKNAVYELKNICKEILLGHKKATGQLYIQGEEDLLALVAILLLPLKSHVWYGQQGVGAIDVEVTEKRKQTVYNLMRKFK